MSRWLSRCPDYEADASYKTACEWYHKFEPDEHRDYTAAAAYAEAEWSHAQEHYDALDRKAEWTFGLAAAGAAVFLTLMKDLEVNVFVCLPSLLFFLLSMATSLHCRTPKTAPVPFSAKDALELASTPRTLVATTAASRHCAVVGLRRIADWKADQIGYAAWLLIFSVALAAVPVVVASMAAPA